MTLLRRLQSILQHDWPVVLSALLLLLTSLLPTIELPGRAYHFQIGFDISQSMNVKDGVVDGQSATRLEQAKVAARELVESLPCGSTVGWSVFAGRRSLTLITPIEVCTHYAALLNALKNISGTMRWKNGSSIGKGVFQLMRYTHEFNEGHSSIILMTDGQEAPPLERGQRGMPKSGELNLSGFLVGVGGDTPQPIPKTDSEGNPAGYWRAQDVIQRPDNSSSYGEELSRRDDQRLSDIARFVRLHYLPLRSDHGYIKQLMTEQYGHSQPIHRDIRPYAAGLILLLLLWRFRPYLARR
ncbi:MAG: vWA domain-containing protein [Granulosicoccus sp.]